MSELVLAATVKTRALCRPFAFHVSQVKYIYMSFAHWKINTEPKAYHLRVYREIKSVVWKHFVCKFSIYFVILSAVIFSIYIFCIYACLKALFVYTQKYIKCETFLIMGYFSCGAAERWLLGAGGGGGLYANVQKYNLSN